MLYLLRWTAVEIANYIDRYVVRKSKQYVGERVKNELLFLWLRKRCVIHCQEVEGAEDEMEDSVWNDRTPAAEIP